MRRADEGREQQGASAVFGDDSCRLQMMPPRKVSWLHRVPSTGPLDHCTTGRSTANSIFVLARDIVNHGRRPCKAFVSFTPSGWSLDASVRDASRFSCNLLPVEIAMAPVNGASQAPSGTLVTHAVTNDLQRRTAIPARMACRSCGCRCADAGELHADTGATDCRQFS